MNKDNTDLVRKQTGLVNRHCVADEHLINIGNGRIITIKFWSLQYSRIDTYNFSASFFCCWL